MLNNIDMIFFAKKVLKSTTLLLVAFVGILFLAPPRMFTGDGLVHADVPDSSSPGDSSINSCYSYSDSCGSPSCMCADASCSNCGVSCGTGNCSSQCSDPGMF